MLIDYRQFSYIQKRASFEVYKKFNINKLELWLLTAIEWHLMHSNRTVAAKSAIFDTITGNNREQAKMRGYYAGLLERGFIGTFEYISQPGSESIGLSDLGLSVLRCYDAALRVFMDKYPKSPYRLNDSPPSFVDEKPTKYTRTA